MGTRARYSYPEVQGLETQARTQDRKPQHCPKATGASGGPGATWWPSETGGELSLGHPSPDPYCFQVTGPKAPWNQAVTTHEQEITRGTCRLSKGGSVGGPSLLQNNSPRRAAASVPSDGRPRGLPPR